MKRRSKVLAFLAGALAGGLGLGMGVHEAGHAIAGLCEGYTVHGLTWGFARMSGGQGWLTPVAGYLSELIAGCLVLYLLYRVGKWSWFVFGYIHEVVIYAPFSSDLGWRMVYVANCTQATVWIIRTVWVLVGLGVPIIFWVARGEKNERVNLRAHRSGLRVDVKGRSIHRHHA